MPRSVVGALLAVLLGCGGSKNSSEPVQVEPSPSQPELTPASKQVEEPSNGPNCRVSDLPLPPVKEWNTNDYDEELTLELKLPIDGDETPDVVKASYSGGSGGGTKTLDVSLASGKTFTVGNWAAFAGFIEITDVPEPVLADAKIRSSVEDLLFERFCKRPEATFTWLTSGGQLTWESGDPVLPERYTFFSEDPALLAKVAHFFSAMHRGTNVWT